MAVIKYRDSSSKELKKLEIPISGGGGTSVEPNPELSGDEEALNSIKIAGTSYKVEGGEQVQSDWTEEDDTAPAFIQNKPLDLVHISEDTKTVIVKDSQMVISPFPLAINEETGEYGYIKKVEGADTFTPFKSGSELVEIPYLDFISKNQYFTTNYYPNQNTIIEYEFTQGDVSTKQQRMFGINGNDFHLYINGGGSFAYSIVDSGRETWTSLEVPISALTPYHIICNIPTKTITINNTNYNASQISVTKAFTTPISFCGETVLYDPIQSCIFKYVKIFENDELLHWYVPYLNTKTNELMIYDKITKEFLEIKE